MQVSQSPLQQRWGNLFLNTQECYYAVCLSVSICTSSFLCWIYVVWRSVYMCCFHSQVLAPFISLIFTQELLRECTWHGSLFLFAVSVYLAMFCFHMTCWDLLLCLLCNSLATVFIRKWRGRVFVVGRWRSRLEYTCMTGWSAVLSYADSDVSAKKSAACLLEKKLARFTEHFFLTILVLNLIWIPAENLWLCLNICFENL